MKRKGFMSIEMLLIIGVLVGGLAGVFVVYKKIQANLASTAIVTDIATIMNGLDRYKGATGGYPYTSTSAKPMTDTGTSMAWNVPNYSYIDKSTANKWSYQMNNVSSLDITTSSASGQISIFPDMGKYNALTDQEVADILRGKCQNGKKALGGIGKVTATNLRCVIFSNVALFKQ